MSSLHPTETAAPVAKPIQVKLVLLGEAAVGKSSLVLRFVNGEFQENKEPTSIAEITIVGAAFLTQKCKLNDKVIKFEICNIRLKKGTLLARSASTAWLQCIIAMRKLP